MRQVQQYPASRKYFYNFTPFQIQIVLHIIILFQSQIVIRHMNLRLFLEQCRVVCSEEMFQ